jgi:hypothetical protein
MKKPIPQSVIHPNSTIHSSSAPAEQGVALELPIVSLRINEGKMQAAALFSAQGGINDERRYRGQVP